MPGPNSAPNGDRRIVKGDPGEHEIQVSRWVGDQELFIWIPLRDYLTAKRRLVTGKTK